MSKPKCLSNHKFLNTLALSLIFIFFLLIIVLSAVGYSNVLSIVAPVSLFIGFWVWMKQEQIKRRADVAEEVIKKYDKYETTILSLWRDGRIKKYSPYEDGSNYENFKLVIDGIIEKREQCNIARSDFESSIKILVRRNNVNFTYTEISDLINEFSDLKYFLSLYNKIDKVKSDGSNFPSIARVFDEIDAYVINQNFGTDLELTTIFDKPRNAVEKHTREAFSLLIL